MKKFELGSYRQEQQAAKARDKALFVLGREDELQIGLSPEEMQQLQGMSVEQLQGSKFSRGTSAYRGVSCKTSSKRWTARIRNQGKNRVGLGSFDTEEEAAHAYDKAARRFHGSKARLNFPDAEGLDAPTIDQSTGAATTSSQSQADAAAEANLRQAMEAVLAAEALEPGNMSSLHEGQNTELPVPAVLHHSAVFVQPDGLATTSPYAGGADAPNGPPTRALSPECAAPAPKRHAARAPPRRGPAAKVPAPKGSAANGPAVKAFADNSPAARALASRTPASLGPTVACPSGNIMDVSGAAANSPAMPTTSASAQAFRPWGAANSPAATSGPGTLDPFSFPLTEQCSWDHKKEEDQLEEEEDEEEEEDSDDELGSDEDLSSWGSDEEIWGSDSDFYNSDDKEDGPMADLLNHPDYKYLVRHNGEPSLSLLGGPEADITPANFLKKIMAKWSVELEESSDGGTASGFGACAKDAVMPERWEEAGGSAGGSMGALEEGAQGGGARNSMSSDGKAAGRRRGAGERQMRSRGSKSMKPPAAAVSMANHGCRSIPGMSPADYREALYSTWRTDKPWGMKLIDYDSDNAVPYSSADEDETLRQGSERRRQTMWLDEDILSTDDEEERTEKRVKLTEAAQAVGEQIAVLQERMGLADGTDAATSQTDKAGSIPWWAQEMGMTEEEYWSGLHSYSSAVASGPDMSQETAKKVEVTQEDLDFLAPNTTTQRRSRILL